MNGSRSARDSALMFFPRMENDFEEDIVGNVVAKEQEGCRKG